MLDMSANALAIGERPEDAQNILRRTTQPM
jgi:hypothetical protein